ncbi:hypothetical protein B5S28_g3686 [[Candida] boidinii]|nr:hypothetical protein B5S28_g3686 [[Candida] boidinii]OWB63487.1 hypothetical protein B5S29_g4470 [[Candida] boidinii]
MLINSSASSNKSNNRANLTDDEKKILEFIDYMQIIEPKPVEPPIYSILTPGGCPPYPIYPYENEGCEVLPDYSPTIYKITKLLRKVEWTTPYEVSNQRNWKACIVELNSTQLNIYDGDFKLNESMVYDPKIDENFKKNKNLKNFNSILTDQSDLKNLNNFKKNCYLNNSNLLRSYSLQHGKIGIAVDYKKRKHILRLRLETEQFLLQFVTVEAMIDWYCYINLGIDNSLDLSSREMPKYRVVPRRRRRYREVLEQTNLQLREYKQQHQQQQQQQQQHSGLTENGQLNPSVVSSPRLGPNSIESKQDSEKRKRQSSVSEFFSHRSNSFSNIKNDNTSNSITNNNNFNNNSKSLTNIGRHHQLHQKDSRQISAADSHQNRNNVFSKLKLKFSNSKSVNEDISGISNNKNNNNKLNLRKVNFTISNEDELIITPNETKSSVIDHIDNNDVNNNTTVSEIQGNNSSESLPTLSHESVDSSTSNSDVMTQIKTITSITINDRNDSNDSNYENTNINEQENDDEKKIDKINLLQKQKLQQFQNFTKNHRVLIDEVIDNDFQISSERDNNQQINELHPHLSLTDNGISNKTVSNDNTLMIPLPTTETTATKTTLTATSHPGKPIRSNSMAHSHTSDDTDNTLEDELDDVLDDDDDDDDEDEDEDDDEDELVRDELEYIDPSSSASHARGQNIESPVVVDSISEHDESNGTSNKIGDVVSKLTTSSTNANTRSSGSNNQTNNKSMEHQKHLNLNFLRLKNYSKNQDKNKNELNNKKIDINHSDDVKDYDPNYDLPSRRKILKDSIRCMATLAANERWSGRPLVKDLSFSIPRNDSFHSITSRSRKNSFKLHHPQLHHHSRSNSTNNLNELNNNEIGNGNNNNMNTDNIYNSSSMTNSVLSRSDVNNSSDFRYSQFRPLQEFIVNPSGLVPIFRKS